MKSAIMQKVLACILAASTVLTMAASPLSAFAEDTDDEAEAVVVRNTDQEDEEQSSPEESTVAVEETADNGESDTASADTDADADDETESESMTDSETEEDNADIMPLTGTKTEDGEYPNAEIPEIGELEESITRSKSATNLDENYESTVTLTVQHDIDLVIVQDGTNLENETFLFLESLEEQANVHVNCGLVIFGGTVPISWTSEELLDLSIPDNMQILDDALNYDGWDDVAGHSGSNVMAGLREARRMLSGDDTHEASDKFIVVMSDCAARMWIEDDITEAIAQARYIPGTNQMFFDTNEDWIERYGQRISQSHNRLGDNSSYLYDYPTFQEVWNAGQAGADIDNYAMTYHEWLEKKEVGDLEGSIAMTSRDEPNVVTMDEYYTNYESATYHTALEFIDAAQEADIHLVSFSYYGYPILQYSYGQYMDEFQEWLGELKNVTRHEYQLNSSKIFSDIMEDIMATEIVSGTIIDEIGKTDDYDFDFIDDIERLHLTAAGEVYEATELTPSEGETSAYGFGDPYGSDDGTTYPFILRYYKDGYTYTNESGSVDEYGECFVLEINTALSQYFRYDEDTGTVCNGISLSYDVVLTNPQTQSGTYGEYDPYGENNDGSDRYGLYTNNQAWIYPKDRPRQEFPKPTVSYEVTSHGIELKKVDDFGEDLDGAVFTLSTVDGDLLYFTVSEDGKTYTLAGEDTEGATCEILAGDVYIKGLSADTYILRETTAPDGYAGLTEHVTIVIHEDGSVSYTPQEFAASPLVTSEKTDTDVEDLNLSPLYVPASKIWSMAAIKTRALAASGIAADDSSDNTWDISKSKKATNLDENFESTVTLSIPSDQYDDSIDIVFVMDGSTSTDNEPLANEASELIRDLSELENVDVNAGLVVFGGSVAVLYSTDGLLDLSSGNNAQQLMQDVVANYKSFEGRSGTNLQAGIEAARDMLNADTATDSSDKFIILLTDAGGRMFLNEDGECVSETSVSSGTVLWNNNEDWLARYGTYMPGSGSFAVPTFADTWAAGQSGAPIDQYAMTEAEMNAAKSDKDYSQMADWDTVRYDDDYYTVYESSAYYAARSIVEGAGEETILYVSYPYYGLEGDQQYTYNYYINSFQEWLGENCVTRYEYDGLEETAEEIFNEIRNDILQLTTANSVLIDEIGYTGTYDFEFIDEIDRLKLTVDDEVLPVTELTPSGGEQSAYGFGEPNGSDDGTTYPFILRYYPDGTSYTDPYTGDTDWYSECFLLEINVDISRDQRVSLSYDVRLTNPQTEAGTYGKYDEYGENNDGSGRYGLYTNRQAVIYPKGRGGEPEPKEEFPKPTVSYSVDPVVEISNHAVVDVEGSKIWDDAYDQDGIRPGYVIVYLLADGEPVIDSHGEYVAETVGDLNDWTWSFTDLPKYNEDLEEIVYSVYEIPVGGYETTYPEGTYDVVNTHEPETIDIEGHKIWEDNDNQDGERPEEIVVTLYADGQPVTDEHGNYLTAVVKAEDDWSWSFTDLPKYRDQGVEIVYTVLEETVTDYTTEYDGDTVINTHNPGKTSVTVNKAWVDNNDQDGKRPAYIIVYLLQNGDRTGDTLVLGEFNNWLGSFTNLDVYTDGVENEYTVEEIAVADYNSDTSGSAQTGYILINSHQPETVDLTGTKTWDDADNQDGKRPEYITVRLYADGIEIRSQEVTANENWAYSFEDLPKYSDGREIVYTVTEDVVDDYTTTYDGYDLTNSYTPGKTCLSVTKAWDDGNDQDGLRPAEIKVILVKNGEDTDYTLTLSEENNWTGSFTDLDVYTDGVENEYTVREEIIDGYENEYETVQLGCGKTGYVLINIHQPETIDIKGTKIWNDGDDQDGIRPDSITVYLLADGQRVPDGHGGYLTAIVSADDGWTWSFTDLPVYDNGVEITYTIEEIGIEGYETEIEYTTADDGVSETVDITNTHTPETVDIEGSKTWDDNNNQDGKRPDSIEILLWADTTLIDRTDVTAADGWAWSFTDLPKYDDGREIVYTVTEEAVDGYTTEPDCFDLINHYTPGKTGLTVEKFWDDADDQDGMRPVYITVELLKNGVPTGRTQTLGDFNGWTASFTDLDAHTDGEENVYTVEEVSTDGYVSEVFHAEGTTTYLIANTHTPETVDIDGSKTWDDDDNRDRTRPAYITIRLYADGTEIDHVNVVEADGWAWSFADLPKYEDGREIVYTITEDVVSGYESTVSGYDVTNTAIPGTVNVEGTKTWADADDQDGIRPHYVTLYLLADGETVTDSHGEPVEETVGSWNDWTWSFGDLPKYNDDGEEIIYSVAEIPVDGYTADYPEGTYDIVNTHTPETVSIEGEKIWADNDDQDGARPASVTVRLYADGEAVLDEYGAPVIAVVTATDGWSWSFGNLPKYRDQGVEIQYTVLEDAVDDYSAVYSGNDIINKHCPGKTSVSVTKVWADNGDQDGLRPAYITVELVKNGETTGETLVLGEFNDWTGSFTDLDEYTGGVKNTYTVEEVTVTDYHSYVTGSADTGYILTNSYQPEKTSVTGTKIWDDQDNQDGVRPDYITIRLYADGDLYDTVEVTEKENWTYSFEDLPKYSGGREIVYTVTEDVVEDYTTTYDGYDVTNSYTPGKTCLSVTKTWDDDNDRDGIRPVEIEVTLVKNGEETNNTLILSEENNWTGSFTDLDVYTDGVENVYTVKEETIAGYDSGYESVLHGCAKNGFTLINTHIPETVDIEGAKTWEDADDQDGMRPAYITIHLYADGEEIWSTHITEEEDWTWSFTDLPKYADGEEIEYTITEDTVNGYETEVNGYNVTNAHIPETIDIEGSKTWDDNDNQDGLRPQSIIIHLYADGVEIDTETAGAEKTGWFGRIIAFFTGRTVIEEDNWSWSFTDLPKYADGKEIVYTITEEVVEGYETTVDGFDVTNTHIPETVDVEGTKTWDDADDQDGIRPGYITIHLLADGEEIRSTHITAEENWTWSFTDLQKYVDGEEIVYTITESEVTGYETAVDGWDVTNTHTPETVSVEGTKTWDDGDNENGTRPESITIRLYADGQEAGSVTVTAEDGWSWNFTDLPKFDHGQEITYTISEDAVEDYTAEVDGYDVTNIYTPGKIGLSVQKIWDDEDDRDGLRPDTIEVILLQNDEKTDQKLTLSDSNNWTGSFTDLDEYTNGVKNEYSVQEETVNGYTGRVIQNGDTAAVLIINTHTPQQETVNISGSKIWDDAGDQDGLRPDYITIRLLADGEETDYVHVTAEENWTWSFTDLPKYADGREIEYTVREDGVAGYESTYETTAEGCTVTNTHTPETLDITGTKTWDDNNNQDGVRPESITIRLYADGEEIDSRTVTAAGGWSWSFKDLPKYSGGAEIAYLITEDAVDGYSTAITGADVTNSYTPGQTSVTVMKYWDDDHDRDGLRSGYEVTLTGTAGGETVVTNTQELNADILSYTWTGLPIYRDGTEIVYTVEESRVPDGYTAQISGDAVTGFEITNTHVPETVSIPVEKIWDDGDGAYGHRPDSIGVALLADGAETGRTLTLTEGTDWKGTFSDLPKYDAGQEIGYTVQEIADETLQYYTPKISGSTEVGFTIINYREYFEIDEEIVPDETDRDSWIKNESVNEYNAIEIEMSTYLPVIEADELLNGSYTMNFHDVLDSHLVLDEADADFTVYIGGIQVDHQYYKVTIDPGDDCSFHVDVDLTALYTDGVITEEDLLGDTEIMIFFYSDLEGTGLNGSYTSTVWYEVYDGEELQYVSNVDVVEVWTYEISVLKYDSAALQGTDYETAALAGATLGIYYDAAGEDPVIRNGEPYTVTSGEDGGIMFYGLSEGTYYILELEAPEGYKLSDQVLTVTLGGDMDSHIYETRFANEPNPEAPRDPRKTADVSIGAGVSVGDQITFTITYYNNNSTYADVTITDVLCDGLDFVSATQGGVYDEESRTVTWLISDAAPFSEGSVEVTATVNQNAVSRGSVDNTAGVRIGDAPAVDTNTVEIPLNPEEPTAPEKSANVAAGAAVAVGDEITYTITYYNNYNDAVPVVITDVLDAGVDFVSATDGGVYDAETHTVTWTIENVPAFTGGSVELTVIVNEDALRADGVSNTASVQVWTDAAVDTNTVYIPLEETEEKPDNDNPDDGNGNIGGSGNTGATGSSGNSGGTGGSGNTGSTGGSGNTGSSGSTDKLPQTGQLNWPIPILTALGVILLGLGIFLTRRSKKKSDA